MRLYVKSDVEELSIIVRNERILDAIKCRDRLIHLKLEKDAKFIKDKEAAKKFVKVYSKAHIGDPVSRIDLPTEILEIVISKVVGTPSILRTRTAIARQLCDLMYVNREFRLACIANLGNIEHLSSPSEMSEYTALFNNPNRLSLNTLKNIARRLTIPVSGLKSMLIVRILNELRIASPVHPSACQYPNAILAVNRDRHEPLPSCVMNIYHKLLLMGKNGEHSGILFYDIYYNNSVDILRRFETMYGSFEEMHKFITSTVDQRTWLRIRCECGKLCASRCVHGRCATCCVARSVACTRHDVR
jgi:hypothetical protein